MKTPTTLLTDPLVAEVRAHRMALLAAHGDDWLAFMRDAMRRQWQSGSVIMGRGPDGTLRPALPPAEPSHVAAVSVKVAAFPDLPVGD